jgi:hypothetical protein
MGDIDKYVTIVDDMRLADSPRDSLFSDIDDMWNGVFELPKQIDKPDIRKVVDLSPHDALKSGSAILSTSMPHWAVQPLVSTQGEYERAENTAYAIDSLYRKLNKRGTSPLLWDTVHSCLRYDSVAIWLDYLPYKFKNRKLTLREKHALRGGDFVATAHNPRNVHIRKDEYGTNSVGLVVNMSAKNVVEKWSYRASELRADLAKMEDSGKKKFVYHDLMVYEGDSIKRVVYGNTTDADGVEDGHDQYVIMNDVIDTPFMPWVVRVGGSGLDPESKYSVHPLLAPLVHSKKWKDLCIFQTIYQSEVIKYGRAPRVKTITPGGDGVEIDFEDGTSLNLRRGEEAEAWRPAPIDDNLKEVIDRVRAEVSSATLPRILQNPEFAGNTPFASINAMIQTALGGLNPAKALCESVHEELAMRMIEWFKKEERPLSAVRGGKSTKEGKEPGAKVEITEDMLDPESILITCRLFAEAPTDFEQRLRSAVTLNKELRVPRSDVLETLGKENVDDMFDRWAQEQQDDMTINLDMSSQQAKLQLMIQAETMKMQMQAQQAQAQQQQKMQMQQQQQVQAQQLQMQKVQALQQQGGGQYSGMQNPNSGVMQPGAGQVTGEANMAAGNPGSNLREQVTGEDVTGASI